MHLVSGWCDEWVSYSAASITAQTSAGFSGVGISPLAKATTHGAVNQHSTRITGKGEIGFIDFCH